MPQVPSNEIPQNDRHIRRNAGNAINNINRIAGHNNPPQDRGTDITYHDPFEKPKDLLFNSIFIIFSVIILGLIFAGCSWLVDNHKGWSDMLVAGMTLAIILRYTLN